MTRSTRTQDGGGRLDRLSAIVALCLVLAAAPAFAENSSTKPTATSSPSANDISRATSGTGTPPVTTTSTAGPSTRKEPTTGSQRPTPAVTPAPASNTRTATTSPPAPNPGRDGTTANPGGSPNPGDFADDVARAEALRSLPPPMPIVRLDKPEFVFSNADPEVAAGVQAWLATLEGPHDKYGNYMGKGYVGSFRPDSVNSKLIAFLANYLAGKRLVAVSAGQATGLAAAQEKSRQDAVDNIVKAKRDAASRAATPPGTGTGARENVPNIKDGTGGRTGTGSQTSTGTTTKTSTSTPSTSNPVSSTGKSKATSSTSGTSGNPKPATTLLEQKFGGVQIDDQPKAFSAEELGYLEDALAKVPPSFYERTELQRTGVISMSGTADEQVFGMTKTSADLPRSAVQISDRSESQKPEDRIDFPSPPYSAQESKRLEFEATVDHELTHRFLRFNPGDKFYSDINQNPLISGENGWAAKFGWSFDPSKQKWSLDPARKREAPTRYAMEDNPSEDMAESVMIYLHDPQRLRSASPERYAFVRDQLKVPEQPDAAQTYPPPKSDPRYASMFAQGN